jgi:hypothetical protein
MAQKYTLECVGIERFKLEEFRANNTLAGVVAVCGAALAQGDESESRHNKHNTCFFPTILHLESIPAVDPCDIVFVLSCQNEWDKTKVCVRVFS